MTRLPAIQEAIEILMGREDGRDLIRRIQAADPYQDKRFAPVMASWVVFHDVTPEEHSIDIERFKTLRKGLKGLRVPVNNPERKSIIRRLLSKVPDDFGHYAHLQAWNREASDILDPLKDLSDEGLPVAMRYDGYTMYRMDRQEHCKVPLVKNTMSWCVTNKYFGKYGGPPYYPIIRDSDKKPFAIITPACFDNDPDDAVRNSQNTGRLRPVDLAMVRPLVQHALQFDRYKHPYINGVYSVTPVLPATPSAMEAFRIIEDYAIRPGEWPEGELVVSQDARAAYLYAKDIIGGTWSPGESAIGLDSKFAYHYASEVIKAPWPPGERAISGDSAWAYHYASKVVRAPWPAGERSISENAGWAIEYALKVLRGRFPSAEAVIGRDRTLSFRYARDVIKGRFQLGETAISQDAALAFNYANNIEERVPIIEASFANRPADAFEYSRDVISGRFPEGEDAISRDAYWSYRYAHEIVGGRWPKGEDAIGNDPEYAYHYAKNVIGGPWPPGEAAIGKSVRYSTMYMKNVCGAS